MLPSPRFFPRSQSALLETELFFHVTNKVIRLSSNIEHETKAKKDKSHPSTSTMGFAEEGVTEEGKMSEPEKGRLKEFSEETTMHGFRYLVENTPTVHKILWLVLLLASSAAMGYQLRKQFLQFQENPIATNIDVQFPPQLHFPSVAICNMNHFRISKTRDLYQLLYNVFKNGARNLSAWETDLAAADTNYPTITDFFMDKKHDIADMLVKCRLPDGRPCDSSHFALVKTDFGPCFAINQDPHRPVSVSNAGFNSGLQLLLNLESYEYMAGPLETIGLKVLIYNQTDHPLVALRALDVPPGYASSIALSVQERNKIHIHSGGTCIHQHPLIHFPPGAYSLEKCRLDKDLNHTSAVCQCSPINAPDYWNAELAGSELDWELSSVRLDRNRGWRK